MQQWKNGANAICSSPYCAARFRTVIANGTLGNIRRFEKKMPVPDMQTRFRDFQGCEFCGKTYTDDKFKMVLIDNEKDGADNEKRIYEMCIYCREKCKTDPAFEKEVTEKVMNQKLGRRVKKIK